MITKLTNIDKMQNWPFGIIWETQNLSKAVLLLLPLLPKVNNVQYQGYLELLSGNIYIIIIILNVAIVAISKQRPVTKATNNLNWQRYNNFCCFQFYKINTNTVDMGIKQHRQQKQHAFAISVFRTVYPKISEGYKLVSSYQII